MCIRYISRVIGRIMKCHLYVLVVLLTLVSINDAQFINSVSARCNEPALYLYGTCRDATQCPVGETALLGNNYCDVFSSFLGRPVTRCVSTLPCCVYGGLCRTSCRTGETLLTLPSDCQDVCCYNLKPDNVPWVSTQSPALTVAQRQGSCGANTVVQRRIIGGAVSLPTDWPWMVRFIFRNRIHGACAGVLVDDDTVVTVAHCVYGVPLNAMQVSLGDFDLTRFDTGQQVVNVRRVIIADRYVPDVRGNDFAIVKLSEPVTPFTSWKLPACLPDPTIVVPRTAQCFIAGWGVTETGQESVHLRAAPVKVMDTELCSTILAAISGNPLVLPANDFLCTNTASTRTDACLFDDGGMLACQDSQNRYTLMGLVTEYSCGNLPTVYTRLDNYTEAILQYL